MSDKEADKGCTFRSTLKLLIVLFLVCSSTAAPTHHHRRHQSSSSSSSESTASAVHFDPYNPCSGGGGGGGDGGKLIGRIFPSADTPTDAPNQASADGKTRAQLSAAMHHTERVKRQTSNLKEEYADQRLFDSGTTRDLESFTFPGLPEAFKDNAVFQLELRDTVESAYHDLVTLGYYLLEAEIHEEMHEHKGFLTELRQLRANILNLLCHFKVIEHLNDYKIKPEITSSVVPPEVSNLSKKSSMRQRDYVILHHVHQYLHQLEKNLYSMLYQ